MEILFSDVFVKSLKKDGSIKKAIQKKVDMIIEHPVALGEPLKGNFRGYYCYPIHKNFLIINLYCMVCRKKYDDKIVLCKDCSEYPDNTIKFIDFGPHDLVFRKIIRE